MNYLVNTINTYRVDSEKEALKLREELKNTDCGSLVSFNYTIKDVKQKGEVVDEYYLVRAKMSFCSEKEPEGIVRVIYTDDPGDMQ